MLRSAPTGIMERRRGSGCGYGSPEGWRDAGSYGPQDQMVLPCHWGASQHIPKEEEFQLKYIVEKEVTQHILASWNLISKQNTKLPVTEEGSPEWKHLEDQSLRLGKLALQVLTIAGWEPGNSSIFQQVWWGRGAQCLATKTSARKQLWINHYNTGAYSLILC